VRVAIQEEGQHKRAMQREQQQQQLVVRDDAVLAEDK
jgi:hypothetical protein